MMKFFINLEISVPPTTMKRTCFQPGEAYSMSTDFTKLFQTFIQKEEGWLYVGLCPEGSTEPIPEFNPYKSIKEEKLNELFYGGSNDDDEFYYERNDFHERDDYRPEDLFNDTKLPPVKYNENKNYKNMKKNTIKLTESDLQNIIKESVNQILREKEENLEEGLWDTAKSFMGQYGKRGAQKAQQMGQAAGERMKQGYNNIKQNVQQGYNNIKNDIQQTAKNARQDSSMKEMQKAFNNFKNAVDTFRQNGGQTTRQLNSYLSAIDKMINNYEQHY